jgi:hypothetical protein
MKLTLMILIFSSLFSLAFAADMTVHPSPLVESRILFLTDSIDESSEIRVLADAEPRPLIVKKENTELLQILEKAQKEKSILRLKLSLVLTKEHILRPEIVSAEVIPTAPRFFSGRRSSKPPVRPLLTENSKETRDVFNQLYKYEARYYNVDDDCFNRAHFWSRSVELNMARQGLDAGTDKIFIFFTDAYQKKYKHKWWYHVAPVIYQGPRETPMVLDPTFLPSAAVSDREWLRTFDPATSGRCKKIESLEEFDQHQRQAVCLYAIANMYSYTPTDIDDPMDQWRCQDFRSLMKYSPPGSKPKSRSPNKDIKWSDSSFAEILPLHCRRR